MGTTQGYKETHNPHANNSKDTHGGFLKTTDIMHKTHNHFLQENNSLRGASQTYLWHLEVWQMLG